MISRAKTGLVKTGFFMALLTTLGGQPVIAASGKDIAAVDNLARVAQSSQQQGVPTVVFVSREACPYCRTLRDEILLPMQRANRFENRAMLVEVSLDRVEPLTGFDDEPTTAQAFGDLYQAQITPTLLFLDPQGKEVSRRIVGISNLELYGYYLQQSIDTALEAIRSGTPGN
jgi:thioredoxin-related protein